MCAVWILGLAFLRSVSTGVRPRTELLLHCRYRGISIQAVDAERLWSEFDKYVFLPSGFFNVTLLVAIDGFIAVAGSSGETGRTARSRSRLTAVVGDVIS